MKNCAHRAANSVQSSSVVDAPLGNWRGFHLSLAGSLLPNELTEPLCFCNVDGCCAFPERVQIGGAKIAVGDGAAWFMLKAPFASCSDATPARLN